MSGRHEEPLDADLLGERRHLMSVAFRMLGTIAEAEDAVQETYIRWYRLSQEERDRIEVPRAWLTRVASRVCLDVLGSARARRERYVGPWLPEPVPPAFLAEPAVDDGDPADRVTLDESVSTALLVVLEAMTPAERVAFVLHDVFAVPFSEIAQIVGRSVGACRQLASSARARIQEAPSRQVGRDEHDRAVRGFAAAARSGDLQSLIAVLDPAVELVSDGGGIVTAARNPIHGADKVARFLLGVLGKQPATEVTEQETHDGLGFALWREGRIVGVTTLVVDEGRVTHLRLVLNPRKLSLWGATDPT
jgi:RNA polymerase sigma factor (sigma-70 family)